MSNILSPSVFHSLSSGIRNLLTQCGASGVPVLASATATEQLNPILSPGRGNHIFGEVVKLDVPDKVREGGGGGIASRVSRSLGIVQCVFLNWDFKAYIVLH